MATRTLPATPVPTAPAGRAPGVLLAAGGALFLAGGPLHPKEDPPGVSVHEHLRVMYVDPAWYLSHTVLLAGLGLMAAALVLLVRRRVLAGSPAVHRVLVLAAGATAAAVPAMLLHLVAAVDAGAIAAGTPTPLTDVQVVVETVTVPLFGLATAALALAGAVPRTLGGRVAAVAGVVGGLGYALAGATFLVTDTFDGLFPAAAGTGLWAVLTGAGLLRRRPGSAAG